MLLRILEYILSVLRSAPALRREVAGAKLARIKIKNFITKRPYVVITGLAIVALFIIFNPQFSPYTLNEKCSRINVDKKQLYTNDGDRLSFDSIRPCEPNHMQAFEFVNLSNTDLKNDGNIIPAVSAGLFIKEASRGIENLDQWNEYTVFQEANHFVWLPANPEKKSKIEQFQFATGECKNGKSFKNQNIDTETREGVLLESIDPRSDPHLPPATWKKCNYGHPGEVGFEECKYLRLQFFIPIGTSEQGCPRRTFLDTWFGVGTKKGTLTDDGSNNTLRDLAKARWDPNRIAPVADETYEHLTTGLPKICDRMISLDGKDVGDWEEFGRISAVWCDL